MKTVDLHVRPIHHRLADRVRAHVFLCMLAYYVEWHLRRAWAPLLFAEDDPQDAARRRGSPVHRFRGLLAHLATLTKNTIQPTGDLPAFDRLTVPTPLQQKAFELLGLKIPV